MVIGENIISGEMADEKSVEATGMPRSRVPRIPRKSTGSVEVENRIAYEEEIESGHKFFKDKYLSTCSSFLEMSVESRRVKLMSSCSVCKLVLCPNIYLEIYKLVKECTVS